MKNPEFQFTMNTVVFLRLMNIFFISVTNN